MNTTELQEKIKEILNNDNYFEVILAEKRFESDYKKTDFYKITKKPLDQVVKEAKIFYALQLNDIKEKIQTTIDSINLDNINEVIDKFGEALSADNQELIDSIKSLEPIVKEYTGE